MIAPVGRLTKKEIIWLHNHRCRHGHTYLEHYNCYLQENPKGLKIGFFDIEASNLKADFGIMLCYCIKVLGKRKIYERCITKEELQKEKVLDKEVVKQCIEDLRKFDKIISYYGSRFDFPYVRSRALFWGLDFPGYGDLAHKDVYYMVRNKLCISRNRLEQACRHVLGKSRKTHIDPQAWVLALQGHEKSLKYILHHCRRDVRDLEDLYLAINGFVKETDRSI